MITTGLGNSHRRRFGEFDIADFEAKMKVKAIVTVSVSIVLDDSWGESCQLDQVFRQAGDKARNIVSQHLAAVKNVTVHRDPKVEAVLTEN